MTENEAIFCIKAESELYPEICDECKLYGKLGATIAMRTQWN